jgi:protein SCO1
MNAMTDRREILKGVGIGVGAALVPTAGVLATEADAPELFRAAAYLCGSGGRVPGEIPNVDLTTQDGARVRFRDHLLDGDLVLVNCMSIAREERYPVAANLARVQRIVQERGVRNARMLSISVRPDQDTPEALDAFAKHIGAGPGWTFLTGSPVAVETVRHTLFDMGASTTATEHDCSLGLIRYGNPSVGLWGAVPSRLDPALIADRLDWVRPRERPTGPARRRGPNPRTYIT